MAWAETRNNDYSQGKLKEYAEIFDARGRDYHKAMLRFPNARDVEFENIIRYADLQDGQVVVDYPSGGGYLQGYINNNVKLVLLENSKVFLQCAQDNEKAGNLPVKRLLVENYKFPIANESCDRFISLAGIHHVEDKTIIFKEMARCLKPGGKFALADVRAGSPTDIFLNDFVHNHSSDGHEGIFLGSFTKNEMESCGFKVSLMKPIFYSWVFDSVEDMVEYARLMFGINRATPRHIERGIARHLGITCKDGKYHMGWELMFFAGVKPHR